MPNRRNSRNRSRRSGGNRAGSSSRGNQFKGSITRVAFHRLAVVALSGVTGNSTVSLTPNNSGIGSLDEIADQFDLFRCVALKYRIHSMDPTDTTVQAAAFVPDIDVQTVTSTSLSQSPIAAVQAPFNGVPSPWIRVPGSQLKGMLDWYKCTADAGAAEFESQGLIILAGGLSDNLTIEIRGMMEFKNPLSATVMLERNISRLERMHLVARLPKAPLPLAGQAGKPDHVTPKPHCGCPGC